MPHDEETRQGLTAGPLSLPYALRRSSRPVSNAPTPPKGILAGLSPEARSKRFIELMQRQPPFAGVDQIALMKELTPSEQTAMGLASIVLLVGAVLQARANRPTVTPEERAAQAMAHWLKTVGPWFARCESFTLNEFAWLCVQADPRDPGPERELWVNEAYKQHDAILKLLKRAVGTSLHALPAVPKMDERFDAIHLVQLAIKNRLEPVALLNVQAMIDYCRTRFPDARGLAAVAAPAAAGEVPATAGNLPANPAPSGAGERRRVPWHDVAQDVLETIERGARKLDVPFDRHAVPESTKQMFALLAEECRRRGLTRLPATPSALGKYMQRAGWRFGGAGWKPVDGRLAKLFAAGGEG